MCKTTKTEIKRFSASPKELSPLVIMAETTVVRVPPQYHWYVGCPEEKDVDIIGPNSSHVCLISSEGHKFAEEREIALISSALPDMLPGKEGQPERVNLGEGRYGKYASTALVGSVCEYLVGHSHCKQLLQQGQSIPRFVEAMRPNIYPMVNVRAIADLLKI